LKYRKTTREPLITICFRIIPVRELKDDDHNLVRSITRRTTKLLDVAEQAFDVMKDKKKNPHKKLNEISKFIKEANGLGDTWAKMLTVCIDLAYPKEGLLENDCEVGTGAWPPLQVLCKVQDSKEGPGAGKDKMQVLRKLLKEVNSAKSSSAKHFWTLLKTAEEGLRKKYKDHVLIKEQAKTKEHGMTASTLQVQLCEYRQYRHSLARLKYGLPDDEAVRGEDEKTGRLSAEDYTTHDESRKCISCEFPDEDEMVKFEVPVAPFQSVNVARRVACICIGKLQDGTSKENTMKFRDALAKDYTGGDDVPENSEAWKACKVAINHENPLVAFQRELKDGSKVAMQTTVTAAGGSILQAERLARLCWQKLGQGKSKDDVISWRNEQYKKLPISKGPAIKRGSDSPVESAAKKRKSS